MSYNLFIDDERVPYNPSEWVVVRTSQEAIKYVEVHGMPQRLTLDHDLGMISALSDENDKTYIVEDTVMIFLKWLSRTYWDGEAAIPEYTVHSANPVGRNNIQSYMESWKRSVSMGI